MKRLMQRGYLPHTISPSVGAICLGGDIDKELLGKEALIKKTEITLFEQVRVIE